MIGVISLFPSQILIRAGSTGLADVAVSAMMTLHPESSVDYIEGEIELQALVNVPKVIKLKLQGRCLIEKGSAKMFSRKLGWEKLSKAILF